ncbi:MAG: Asp23/Gls24 family envelope stress response protein, partial [Gammaproteobacteria bacterium]
NKNIYCNDVLIITNKKIKNKIKNNNNNNNNNNNK